jgi:hypothetical protein
MTKLDELRKEYEDLSVSKSHTRIEMRNEWRKEHPSALYRATHEPTSDQNTVGMWVLCFTAVFLALMAVMSVVAPNTFYKVGDDMYHLNADDTFTCPHCGLMSDTYHMATYDGYYYYRGQCGNVMGHLNPGMKHGPN